MNMWIVTVARAHRKAPEGTLDARVAYAGLSYNDALRTAVDEGLFFEQKRGYKSYDSGDNFECLGDRDWIVTIRIHEISKQNW